MQTGGVDQDELGVGPGTMPRTTVRVVCGREDVIATFVPTRALVSVDLPAFGRPTNEANPLRKEGALSGTR